MHASMTYWRNLGVARTCCERRSSARLSGVNRRAIDDFRQDNATGPVRSNRWSPRNEAQTREPKRSGATSTATVTVTVGVIAQISLSSLTHRPAISFSTAVGKNYFVQCVDSLVPNANWNVLATNLPGSGSIITVQDTNPPAQRFYRVGAD